MRDAAKDATNPHFKSKYATLASVREAVTPSLTKHGLSVVQLFEPHGFEGVCIITVLMHSSGEWIQSKLVLPVAKKDPQGMGSAISYGRRYQLAAICGIATDDDDDANAAAGKPVEQKTPPAPAAQSSVDVDALVRALDDATNESEIARAELAVGRVKEKLSKKELDRCIAARAHAVQRLVAKEAAAQ
jgi:hypothetical protein